MTPGMHEFVSMNFSRLVLFPTEQGLVNFCALMQELGMPRKRTEYVRSRIVAELNKKGIRVIP